MSKQIYIDSNGNEIQVSGTVNTADMMPMSGNDSTKVSEAIGDLSQLTTSVKSSLVGAVNEVNGKLAVTTGTVSTTNTHITLLRSTLVKYGEIKILSVIFQWDGTGTVNFDLSSGFSATYNVDFSAGDDAGKTSRYRIQSSRTKVECFASPTFNSYTTFTVAYI